jgi:hypothetical protein
VDDESTPGALAVTIAGIRCSPTRSLRHCWSQFGFLAVGRLSGHYAGFGVTSGLAVTRPEHEQLGFLCLDWSMSASTILHKPRMDRRGSPDYIEDSKRNPAASVFAQQDQRIDRKRALRGNPRRHQTQQGHRHHHTGQDQWVAGRCLVDDVGEHASGEKSKGQSRD